MKGTLGMTDTSELKKLQFCSLSYVTLLLLLLRTVSILSLENGWRKTSLDGR